MLLHAIVFDREKVLLARQIARANCGALVSVPKAAHGDLTDSDKKLPSGRYRARISEPLALILRAACIRIQRSRRTEMSIRSRGLILGAAAIGNTLRCFVAELGIAILNVVSPIGKLASRVFSELRRQLKETALAGMNDMYGTVRLAP